jgi:5-formyltetrahydrofolate cyclo-ligase
MANAEEAPAGGYARFFHDAGHTIALPHFATRSAHALSRLGEPHLDDLLEPGPYGTLQPTDTAADRGA